MIKFETDKLIKPLSGDDLECFVAGGELSRKSKQILKWIGMGTAGAAILAGAGVSVAAIVGWQTGKGKFGYLHDEFADIPYDKNIEISRPCDFYHYEPTLSEKYPITTGTLEKIWRGINSIKFTKNGPKLF